MAEKVKEKKKLSKGKKALAIIVCIILFIAIASVIFINITTRPKLDTDSSKYPVGGMVYSETVDYQDESGNGIKHNPVIRLMQMVWRFCADGDAAKHAVQTPPENIHTETNIPYIDDGNIYHKLDIYYPEGADYKKLPIIIDIHGGGWIYGDKELNKYYCLELANKGYCVFNLNYRLVPDVTVNEQITDCNAALKFIAENYNDYNLENIMLTGDSAGGMLATYTAAINSSQKLQKAFNCAATGLSIDALVLTSPVAYMKDAGILSAYTKPLWGSNYKEKDSYNFMDLSEIANEAEFPPTYFITSDGDALAHDQTHRAAELFAEKGIKHKIVNFGNDENGKSLPHVFSVLFPFDKSGQEAIDGALEFYQSTIN